MPWQTYKHISGLQRKYTLVRRWRKQLKLDSIAVPLFTNSETAAATPLRVMRNFQRTSNQWRHHQTDCFLIDQPSPICQLTFGYVYVIFCLISRSWGGDFLNQLLKFGSMLTIKFGETLLLVGTKWWTNRSFPPNHSGYWYQEMALIANGVDGRWASSRSHIICPIFH